MLQPQEDRSACHEWSTRNAVLHASWIVACIVVWIVSIASQAHAQYRSTQWTADSGLPQKSVRGIVLGPDGYIWVATLNGVARFDGIRFTVFDKSNTPGISSNRFASMVAGARGDLWLGGEDDNVVHYHDGHFETLGTAAGLSPHSIAAITTDHRGGVWVDSNDKVFRWIPERDHFEKEPFSTDDLHFVPLWWVGTGCWATRGETLLTFARGVLKTTQLPQSIKASLIRGVAVGADGVTWIGMVDRRFGRLIDGKYVVQKVGAVITTLADPGKSDWKVLISQNFERTLIFPSGGLNKGIQYNIIITDNEHNTWVGSEIEGLFRIQKQSIQTLSSAQGLASDNIYPILKSRNGDMWVGSWPAGLTRIHDEKPTAFTAKDGLPGLVSALAEDRSGTIWVATHNGLRLFSGNRFSIPPGLPIEKLPDVQVIHQMPDGAMLLGTPKGLYVLAGANSRWIKEHDGLATDDVRVILEDSRGDTWIGGYGGLTRMHNGVMTRWTEVQGLPSNNIRSIIEDSDGQIWIGTYDGGIGWLRNGRWVNFNQTKGLHDNGAFQILEDAQQRFWISSNHGIYRVSKKQLQDVAENRATRADSIVYGVADGMLSVECNGGLWPAGAKDDHGVLWFPTQQGVAIIDPMAVSAVSQPPRVAIESASIEHKLQSGQDKIVLHPGQTNLEVQYTALSYTKPEQISFRYKLDGVDENWQEVGWRRTAYYSHLPPGDYVFRVSARNSDGIVSLKDSTMLVTVIPPFYRRPWFISLAFLTAISLLAMLWGSRVRQLKKVQAAQQAFSRELIASQENERRRIAAELHDSLGQRLIIINNLALFLLRPKGKVRTEEDKLQTIEEISAEASQAIEETRAISYALRPFQLDRLGLSKATQALIKTVARASQIDLTADIEDIDEAFPEDLRINFFRIVQEGLNNIVKHSGATKGNVTAKRTPSAILLTISDNGSGLPSEPRSVSAGLGGFGMTGIRERAALLQGTLEIKSDSGVGTLLIIDFPLRSEQRYERHDWSTSGGRSSGRAPGSQGND